MQGILCWSLADRYCLTEPSITAARLGGIYLWLHTALPCRQTPALEAMTFRPKKAKKSLEENPSCHLPAAAWGGRGLLLAGVDVLNIISWLVYFSSSRSESRVEAT